MSTEKNTCVRIIGQTGGQFVVRQGNDEQAGGGQAYPFLQRFEKWGIINRSAKAPAIQSGADAIYPSLRTVKDGKVIDILIPTDSRSPHPTEGVPGLEDVNEPMRGLSTADFLNQVGLNVSLRRGDAVLSKRLSRVFSPYRWWAFMDNDDVNIVHSDEIDPAVWDGIGLVSRDFMKRYIVACQIAWMQAGIAEKFQKRYTQELLHCNRFEITIMTEQGQEKGDVVVVDTMPHYAKCADFLFPTGSTKTEVAFHKGVFVGVRQPRHAKRRMRLDAQSLINLYGFFTNEQLIAWLEADSAEWLAAIADGRTDTLMSNMLHAESAAELDKLTDWWLGDYFASGGQAMWFSGVVQALGRQRNKQLNIGTQMKSRFPIPGGRYYIAPASTVGIDVPCGFVHLSDKYASAFVNDADWKTYIVDVLGGADGDDAVWCLPFTDVGDVVDEIDPVTGEVTTHDGKRVLLWRSPNQPGEYVLLHPTDRTADLDYAWAEMDSRALPTRIDEMGDTVVYGELPVPPSPAETPDYSIQLMTEAIARTQANSGVLGSYVNVLMVCYAMLGRLPKWLPARLEDVIDGSVKDGRDLSPVMDWCQNTAVPTLTQHLVISAGLVHRIAGFTDNPIQTTTGHWYDQLLTAAKQHLAELQQQVNALSQQTCPPIEALDIGIEYAETAAGALSLYRRRIAQTQARQIASASTYANAHAETLTALKNAREAQIPTVGVMCGLMLKLYVGGVDSATADNILWQSAIAENAPCQSTMTDLMLATLRHIGLLGDPTWSEIGAVLAYEDAPETEAVAATFNGAWFNLNAANDGPYTTMRDVPKPLASQLKASLADQVTAMVGTTLALREVDGRIVADTSYGVLFGYLKRGQEPALAGIKQVMVRYAEATADGNVGMILQPVK